MSSSGTLLMEVSNGGTATVTTGEPTVDEGAATVESGCAVGAGPPGDGVAVAVAEVPQAAAISSRTGIQKNKNVLLPEIQDLVISGLNNRVSDK
jgi:hypothetical protein